MFDWFWQPPQAGDPGIMMIVETHPGPEATDIPFVHEDLVNVLLVCESRIPADVHLYQLRIYFRDVFRMWTQLEFNILGRQFQKTAPDFTQGDLEQVWENHETTAGRA